MKKNIDDVVLAVGRQLMNRLKYEPVLQHEFERQVFNAMKKAGAVTGEWDRWQPCEGQDKVFKYTDLYAGVLGSCDGLKGVYYVLPAVPVPRECVDIRQYNTVLCQVRNSLMMEFADRAIEKHAFESAANTYLDLRIVPANFSDDCEVGSAKDRLLDDLKRQFTVVKNRIPDGDDLMRERIERLQYGRLH